MKRKYVYSYSDTNEERERKRAQTWAALCKLNNYPCAKCKNPKDADDPKDCNAKCKEWKSWARSEWNYETRRLKEYAKGGK